MIRHLFQLVLAFSVRFWKYYNDMTDFSYSGAFDGWSYLAITRHV